MPSAGPFPSPVMPTQPDADVPNQRVAEHLHADETTWRVFAPGDGDGPAKWWLWVFIGPDTVRFVMDPSRSGAVLARHAGIDVETGQLTAGEDGGPRSLVISSDFYKVYESAGKKADGLVNLYCLAHLRRHFVRAGDANPVQLKYWTDAWLERIRDLYRAHDELGAAWQDAAAPAPQRKEAAAARLEKAYEAWDDAITVIDGARNEQMQAPGLAEPAKKALATLDREWAASPRTAATRWSRWITMSRSARSGVLSWPGRTLAALITGTPQRTPPSSSPSPLPPRWPPEHPHLSHCLPRRMRPQRREATRLPALERFLPWNASPEDLRTWAQPPAPG